MGSTKLGFMMLVVGSTYAFLIICQVCAVQVGSARVRVCLADMLGMLKWMGAAEGTEAYFRT